MNKLNRGLEHFWLAAAIGTTIYALWAVYQEGWETGRVNFFIPAIAIMWFFFRRGMRKRMEKMAREQNNQQNEVK